jgi:hypothetical protein
LPYFQIKYTAILALPTFQNCTFWRANGKRANGKRANGKRAISVSLSPCVRSAAKGIQSKSSAYRSEATAMKCESRFSENANAS